MGEVDVVYLGFWCGDWREEECRAFFVFSGRMGVDVCSSLGGKVSNRSRVRSACINSAQTFIHSFDGETGRSRLCA